MPFRWAPFSEKQDVWLKKEGRTKVWLNNQISDNPRRVETILLGAEPTLQEAVDIETITLGRVRIKDWLERAKK